MFDKVLQIELKDSTLFDGPIACQTPPRLSSWESGRYDLQMITFGRFRKGGVIGEIGPSEEGFPALPLVLSPSFQSGMNLGFDDYWRDCRKSPQADSWGRCKEKWLHRMRHNQRSPNYEGSWDPQKSGINYIEGFFDSLSRYWSLGGHHGITSW